MDLVHQKLYVTFLRQHETGVSLVPLELRYAWPDELDLMAKVAGLRLHARYSGWRGQPFGIGSSNHVSVYAQEPTGRKAGTS